MNTASELVERARSLADLQNSQNITYADETNLLNEAYRQMYSRYTESNGDYFVSEYLFTLLPAWLDPNVPTGTDWLVPLPVDFYKIRFLDWQTGGQWYPVNVFSTSGRNGPASSPRYRLKNNTLWLIVSPGTAVSFRMAYYTPPEVVTLPEPEKDYGSSIAAYLKPLALWPTFAATGNTLIYVYNGTDITAESEDGQTSTVLFTAAGAVTWLTYYKGYLYWVQAGNILRAPTNLTTAPLIPVTIVNTGNVQGLSISKNLSANADALYWYNGTNTIRALLDGTSQVVLMASASFDYLVFVSSLGVVLPTYITSLSGNLTVNGTVVLGLVQHVRTDGVYLYILNTLNEVRRLSFTGLGAISENLLLFQGISFIGPWAAGFLPAIWFEDSGLAAVSTVPDTVFDFPTNEVNELMAYQAGLSFARKSKDTGKVAALDAALNAPGTGLWARFDAVNQRDEYQNQRVNNDYRQGNPGGWW